MKDNKRSVVVGIFVLLGVLFFTAGVLILGGQQKRFARTIQVNAVFKDVAGLKAGNNVWFSGVKIGTVKRINIYDNARVHVELNIEEKATEFIRKDAKATISSEGFIGNKLVVLFGGTPQQPSITDGDELQTQEALSSDKMLETLQENNQNLLKVTNDFKELVGNIRRGRGVAGAVLTDSSVANRFRSMMVNLEQTSSQTAKVSRSLSDFSAKLNTRGGLANELVTDTTVYRRLRASASQLDQATQSATQVARNLQQTSSRLNDPNTPLGTMLNDEEAARNLKATLRNLNTGSAKLDENMEALQHNFLLRGFFRRKAKEEAKQKEEKSQTIQPVQQGTERP